MRNATAALSGTIKKPKQSMNEGGMGALETPTYEHWKSNNLNLVLTPYLLVLTFF